MDNETNVVAMTPKSAPLVSRRTFTTQELQDVACAVWRIAKNQASRYDGTDTDNFSINQLASVAVAQAMCDEFGEAFEVPAEQYERLFYEYVEQLAQAKLRRQQ